jgi:ribonuclease Z
LNLLFEDKKLEVFSFPLKHRIFCTGFLFKEKPLPRKIDKYLLKKLNISVADILLLKNGLNVTNQEGQTIQNKEVTIDPDIERSYAYCSDTIFNPKLTDYISNVDLLYHESTFLEEHADRAKKTYHSTAKQAAEMAKKTNAKQLLLGHFSARYSDLDLFLNEAEPIFKNCILAIDGKKIKI